MPTPTVLDTPCREWMGPRLPSGYGRLSRDGQRWYVHRWVWTLANGPIPEGMQVCHRCDNPPCFRLDHLFLGTQLDNMHDKVSKGRHNNQVKTHCSHGHEFTPDNIFIDPATGARRCRACRTTYAREYYHRVLKHKAKP